MAVVNCGVMLSRNTQWPVPAMQFSALFTVRAQWQQFGVRVGFLDPINVRVLMTQKNDRPLDSSSPQSQYLSSSGVIASNNHEN